MIVNNVQIVVVRSSSPMGGSSYWYPKDLTAPSKAGLKV